MEKIWFLCFFPVMLLHFFMSCFAITPPNITTDQYALLAFKSHITIDLRIVLTHNWSTATSCCSWIGVTCGARHQRVTALNLPNMDLTGTIPPHLGNLSFLASINIRNNSFHGHLPDELVLLHRLKAIHFEYNNFSGEVPFWFGVLPKLQHLLLFNNNFSGSIPSSDMLNMPSLQTLELDYNSLSGTLPEDLCNQLPKLKNLSLSRNQFYGKIPSGIYKCRQLQHLSLDGNQFLGSIPRELGNLTMLKELYLGDTNLQLEGVIPVEMGNLISLEELIIYGTSLTGPIPSVIFNISSLKYLEFGKSTLSGTLPEDICDHLPFLEELHLHINQLTGRIPSNLWRCRELVILNLADNRFTGSIPREIGNLTMMKGLSFGENNLKGKIPREIGYLHGLEILGIELNNLTGAIPHEIGNLGNLKALALNANGLIGLVPSKIFNISTIKRIFINDNHLSGQLPSNIGLWLPNLEELNAWGNELSGVIPSSISNASKLSLLDLSANSFTGPIPNTLGNLRLLERLNIADNFLTTESSSSGLRSLITPLTNCKDLIYIALSYNPLGGILPVSIGNLSTSLQDFSAFDCGIKGSIPREIGNLSNLISLHLGSNELTGSIPTTIGRLWTLQYLDLGVNRLEGSVPYDLCHLKSLAYVHLEDNKLFGMIPSCVGNLTSIRYLYLNSNKFTIIPSTLWSLTDILELVLSTNSISGFLPLDVKNLKVVRKIDLSKNQLSGDIPNTIGSLQNLVNLTLANNRLQGPIPQSLGNSTSLEFLDLSNNNLSGAIPKSLEALKYLKYLNVSFNRLEGEIPNGGLFANFSAQSFVMNDALCGTSRLPVPPCKSSTLPRSKKTAMLLKYILITIAATIFIVALIFVFITSQKRKKGYPIQADSSPLAWRRISYQELQQATNGFCESNLLGIGSFGSVYKGILLDGVNVAIKVFNLQQESAFKSFDAECEVMRNIRHRNLTKIISSCTNIDFKALIIEYMPNGSLEKWLYSHNYCLDMLQRLNIMIDVALALEYLHHDYSTSVVVHCDLKPSNVLLDEDMVAHISDFGIAKLLGEEESMAQTKTLATIGYMAPEYGSEGVVSPRGDVYSYGILLMETFTRKKPTDEMFVGEMSLKRWVKESLPHAIIEIADANLLRRDEEHFVMKKDCISSILELALNCCADLPEERVDMKVALATLNNILTKFQRNDVGTQNILVPSL